MKIYESRTTRLQHNHGQICAPTLPFCPGFPTFLLNYFKTIVSSCTTIRVQKQYWESLVEEWHTSNLLTIRVPVKKLLINFSRLFESERFSFRVKSLECEVDQFCFFDLKHAYVWPDLLHTIVVMPCFSYYATKLLQQ